MAEAEQDSDEDVDACVYAILATPLGHLTHLPEFGTPDQAFRQGGADLDELERCVEQWEDRADVAALRDSGRLAELAAGTDRVSVEIRRAR